MNQEHSAFADATVGGIHTPGGCAVLAMEISDDGGDITTPVVGDGTYRARGLVWAWDGSQNAILWCATKAAGNSTTGDWTVLMMHPDKQWAGRDVTWAGAHEFDASVDISGPVRIHGAVIVDSSSDISDVYVNGDISMTGSIKVATDVSITGDMAIDGTSNFYDEVDVSSLNASGVVSMLSAYTDEDSNTDTMLVAHAYKAATDGFVTVYATTNGEGRVVKSYVGLDNDPEGTGDIVQYSQTYGNGAEISQNFPVAKDEYFEVVSVNATATVIRWKSMGVLSKPVDQD